MASVVLSHDIDVVEDINGDADLKHDPAIHLLDPNFIHPAILDDHAFIRRFLPALGILTLTKEFVTVIILRTQYARIQLRVQYLPKYPDEAPIVELSSATLPQPLLRTKEKACIDIAKENLGKPQVKLIYEYLYHFIHTNLFVPCWKEMKQISTLCDGKGQMSIDEKEGVLQIRLQKGRYKQTVKLKIPPIYPEEGVIVEFTASNFPQDTVYMFKSQAEEIVRRCVAGLSPDQALNGSNPIKMASAKSGPKLTSGNLKNLKHDVTVLKQMSDLRSASTASSKSQYTVHANAERREARKDLRRLARAEAEAEEELERQQRELEQAELKDLLKCKVSEIAQPSLLPVARFLVGDYATRLPREVCQACQQPAFPEDPLGEPNTNTKSKLRPMRTFCGHWLHYKCLDAWLSSPPFIRQCPLCDRRIWHPDWPEDHKVLEKAWQSKEAKKREMSDVSDFMGMGDEFSTDAAKAGTLGSSLF